MDISINIRVEWGIFKDLNDTNIAMVTFVFARQSSLECNPLGQNVASRSQAVKVVDFWLQKLFRLWIFTASFFCFVKPKCSFKNVCFLFGDFLS